MAKRNSPPESAPIVDREILKKAKLSLEAERPRPTVRCVICSGESAPNSTENLCWVCRRLKISAWRDVDQQMPAQE
jgi:hypothetical protein